MPVPFVLSCKIRLLLHQNPIAVGGVEVAHIEINRDSRTNGRCREKRPALSSNTDLVGWIQEFASFIRIK